MSSWLRRVLGYGVCAGLFLTGLVLAQGEEPDYAAVASADIPEISVKDIEGYKIYHVPFYRTFNTAKVELFPHHDPLKKRNGWKMAYADLGFKESSPIYVEEIPAHSPEVLGQRLLAEITFFVVSGEGVGLHRRPDGSEQQLAFRKGDIFFIPYGHWVGFANLSNAPVRLSGCGTAFVPEILDQDLPTVEELGRRPAQPFVIYYLRQQKAEPVTSAGQFQPDRLQRRQQAPNVRKADFTVYQPQYGTVMNIDTLEIPPHHFPKRRAEGWRDAHIETGGRIQNNFIVQEATPGLKEIGHKHQGGALFFALQGKGYLAIRPEVDSPERRIMWAEGEYFMLPPWPGGIWHAHNNYTEEKNRFLAVTHIIDRRIWDPYEGRTSRAYTTGEDRDQVWEAIRPGQ